MYKYLKMPFFGRFMVRWKNPLTAEQQQEWQRLEVASTTGGKLAALFATAKTEQPKATIVLGHPMGKEAKGYFLKHGYTDLLRSSGYHVLIFDINGFGESTHGNFSYFKDIVAIGQKARELSPGLPIGYHGISLGGQWATISFSEPDHCYDFAIVESAATTLPEFWIHFPFAYRTLQVFSLIMPGYKKRISMIDRIKGAHRLKSILFIYSETDHWTPVSMGHRFVANSGVPAEIWTVPDAPHAMIVKSEHAEQYWKKVLEYFDRMTANHAV